MKKGRFFTLLLCSFWLACSDADTQSPEQSQDSTTQTEQKGQAKEKAGKEMKLSHADIEEKVLQVKGLWQLKEANGESAEWFFEEESFVHRGKNASYAYEEKGVYHISRISGDTISLYLDDIEGTFGNDSRIISLIMNKQGDIVSLNNQQYRKVK